MIPINIAHTMPWPEPQPGDRVKFHSVGTDEVIPGTSIRLRTYSGSYATVVRQTQEQDEDGDVEAIYLIRFDDNMCVEAFADEINGWFYHTGQFYHPDGTFEAWRYGRHANG